jgi:hypothetical protein
MELSRAHFSGESLSVMDQVAHLLYLSEQILGLSRTFTNNGDIEEASADAREIVQYARSISVSLTGALFHNTKKRRHGLSTAHNAARSGIAAVIEAAQRLAIMEARDTADQGNIVSYAVLPSLVELQRVWVGLHLHVTEGIGGVWHYHLSEAGTNATSLCGAKTMNTSIPLASWGARGHLKEGWCVKCATLGVHALQSAGIQTDLAE